MNTSNLIIKNGALTGLGIFFSIVFGASIVYISLEFPPLQWLKIVGLSIGLSVMGIGGYSGRAKALGLPPPFTSDPLGWRKAKDSYKPDAAQKDSGK